MMKRVLIATGIIAVLGMIVIGFLVNQRSDENQFTGGYGQPESGTLILTGYEVTSNDSSKINLGSFLSSDQQAKIRTYLESLLFNENPQKEYSGKVIPGSVNVDYVTNDIQFKVKIDKPDTLYDVKYNSVSDEMSVFDEKGQILTPPKQ